MLTQIRVLNVAIFQELEEERNKLREQLAELSQRVESLDHDNVSSLAAK